MIDYSNLYRDLTAVELAGCEELPEILNESMDVKRHGDLQSWFELLEQFPSVTTEHFDLNSSVVSVGKITDIDKTMSDNLYELLQQLCPWRKGPFSIFDIKIDTEWRSDWKWDRLSSAIQPLKSRLVLDVGCGSGYHCFRMLAAGARTVIGIEPMWRYNIQFHVLKKYLPDMAVHMLPLTLEATPQSLNQFDTVFSMGVLYHRKSPFDHLAQLKARLRAGGELVIETLVVEGDENTVLVPADRYARMRNVWFLPSTKALEKWLTRAGLDRIELIDVSATTVEEQRATQWINGQSLAECLDKQDRSKTIEGYPAPLRAIFTARRPG